MSGLRHTLGKRAYVKAYRGFESPSLRHVSWIKMLSTAKTSENTSFSEVFCCFWAKIGLLRTFKTGFDFVLSFDRFSCKTGLEPCDFFGDQIFLLENLLNIVDRIK